MSDRIHVLAKAELQRTDWKLMRALERTLAGPEWCDWRDEVRRLVRANEGVSELPPEPPFGVGAGFGERVEIPVEVIREVTVEVPGPERIVEVIREVMVPAPAPEGVPVGNTLPETEAVAEADAPPRDVIPDALAPFARDDEDADEFRERIKWLWQRFGIKDGHHTADMPALSAEEKIEMREIDIANERSGNWVGR